MPAAEGRVARPSPSARLLTTLRWRWRRRRQREERDRPGWWRRSRGPMGARCARIAIDGEEEEEARNAKKAETRTCTPDDGVTGAARDMNYVRCWRPSRRRPARTRWTRSECHKNGSRAALFSQFSRDSERSGQKIYCVAVQYNAIQ